MPKAPTLSVAMATYNGERFLLEQLESLAAQTLPPCELVVCDDGSTDGTLPLLDRWASSSPFPVHVHRNPMRLGFADNFLRAASLCTGDLTAFCDQDDVWLPEKLARCTEHFKADADVMLVSHNAWVTDMALAKTRLLHSGRRNTRYRHCEMRLLDYYFFGFGIVFRSKVIRAFPWAVRAQDYILDAPMPHDHWVPFLAAALGGVVIDAEPLALYRQHGRNTLGADWDGDTPEYVTHTRGGSVREQLIGLQGRLGDWGDFLAALSAQTVGEPDHSRLQTAGERYTEISRRYGFRAALYQRGLGAAPRVQRLMTLARAGGYRSSRNGGLGARPLLRDLLTVGLGSGICAVP